MALEPAQLKSSGSCCRRHSACSTEKAGKRWLVSASRPSHWNSNLGEREGEREGQGEAGSSVSAGKDVATIAHTSLKRFLALFGLAIKSRTECDLKVFLLIGVQRSQNFCTILCYGSLYVYICFAVQNSFYIVLFHNKVFSNFSCFHY